MSRHCLILGASGQVATALARRLEPSPWRVSALGRNDADLADPAVARASVLRLAPDVVINAAAYTAVDKAETDAAAAMALNTTGPAAAAAAAAELGAPFIHFSTDYVFDGSKGAPYVETDAPQPLGVYGASKLAGEYAVAAANPAHVIIRTSWVCSATGANFVRTMLRLAGERDEIAVVDDQWGRPTFAPDLADATARIMDRVLSPESADYGVFHLTGAGDTTWRRFAAAIMEGSKARGGPAARVRPIPSSDYPTPVRRPLDSRLDCRRITEAYGVEPRCWREALDDCLDEIYRA